MATMCYIKLQITTLLALGAFSHGITQLGGRVLLLQLLIHGHDLLVPVGGTARHLTALALLGLALATHDRGAARRATLDLLGASGASAAANGGIGILARIEHLHLFFLSVFANVVLHSI